MPSRRPPTSTLCRLALAFALVMQAAVGAVLTAHLAAAQAFASDRNLVIICTEDGLRAVPADTVVPGESPIGAACECPSGSACSVPSLAAPASVAYSALARRATALPPWPESTRALPPATLHLTSAGPRSPPADAL